MNNKIMTNIANRIMTAVLSLSMAVVSIPFSPIAIQANAAPTTWNYTYEEIGDSYAEWEAATTGIYKVEVWGASGGGCSSATGHYSGGYSWMTLNVIAGTKFYIYCGEQGSEASTSYNRKTYGDGGAGLRGAASASNWSGSGGGSTSVRTTSGDITSNYDKLLVLAGGGGGRVHGTGNTVATVFSEGNNNANGENSACISNGSTNVDSGYVTGASGGGMTYSGQPMNSTQKYLDNGVGGAFGSQTDGQGGSGFIDLTKALDSALVKGGNLGNGRAKITYVKPITSKLTVKAGKKNGVAGSYNGASNESGDFEFELEYGQTVTLVDPTLTDWTFKYWTYASDMSQTHYPSGYVYTAGLENEYLVANYVYEGNAKMYTWERTNATTNEQEKYIHVNNVDDGLEKYVKFFASRDNGATFEEVNSDGCAYDPSKAVVNYTTGATSNTYVVPATGLYSISARGADGSYASTNMSGWSYGAAGNEISGTAKLNYGEKIIVNVGSAGSPATYRAFNGNGWPNGGTGWGQYSTSDSHDKSVLPWQAYTGGGGGATSMYLNSQSPAYRILVAGGGGGGGAFNPGWDDCGQIIQNNHGGFGGQGNEYGRNGQGEKYGGNSGERRAEGGGGGGFYGGTLQFNGTNGFMAARVSNVRSSTASTSGGSFTRYSRGGEMGTGVIPTNARSNGWAKISLNNAEPAILAVDSDFRIRPYDTIAPDAPEKLKASTNDGKFRIGWTDSADHGEKYLYKSSIYQKVTNTKLYDCEDKDTGAMSVSVDATSGTKGYYYIYTATNTTYDIGTSIKNYLSVGGSEAALDGNTTAAGAIVAGQTVKFAGAKTPYFELSDANTITMYIYVAAVDFAGNISMTKKLELLPGYEISVNPNGGIFRGSEETQGVHATFGTSIPIENPTRDGFEFVGWDISGMDTEIHYYDTTTATTSSPHTNDTSIDHNTITSNIKAFMDLRHSAGDVSFVAIWKDVTAPVLDEKNHNTPECSGDSGENGIRYTVKEDGSNPDGVLYATFTTPDGAEYIPGTWTNKSVLVDVKLFDGTGFSKIETSILGTACPNSDNTPLSTVDTTAYQSMTYTSAGGSNSSLSVPQAFADAKISVTYNIPTVNSIKGRQHANTTATFTSSGRYGGTITATDNAGDVNYLASIRNWIPNTKNFSSSFTFGQILIDKEAPVGEVSYSTEDWTNEDVTVTVTASDRLSGLHSVAYSWDHGATWTTDNTKTFEEMTVDYVYVRDAVGNWTQIGYKVGNIDKYEPWTDDMYHIHSTQSELHEWQNDVGGIEFSYTSKDIPDPGSSSKASGISQIILFEADENFNKGSQLTEVHSEYIAPSMSIDESSPDGMKFISDENPLTITWTDHVQGTTYYVLETYDRAGNITTVDLVYKWDVTPPVIEDPYVHQTSLDEFTEDEIEAAIVGDLYCYFNYLLSDYNRPEFDSDITREDDSSGIDEIVVVLMNAEDHSQTREIKYSLDEMAFIDSWRSRNPGGPHVDLLNTYNAEQYAATGALELAADEDAILKGYIGMKLNTYEAFPDWSAIDWVIYAVDRAGNSTNDNASSLVNIAGESIKNFSIKTVIYSDEYFDNGESLNIKQTNPLEVGYGNNVAYFRTGDIGYTKTWTVGYVEEISTDFKDVGSSSAESITKKELLPKYNLGIDDATFVRKYSYTIGTPIASGRADNAAGVPYATRYDRVDGWWDPQTKYSDGTMVRISPYYKLNALPGQFKADGTPKYESETKTYIATAKKHPTDSWTDSSSGLYVIWDTSVSEIHYRVTHEHHGSVTQTVE